MATPQETPTPTAPFIALPPAPLSLHTAHDREHIALPPGWSAHLIDNEKYLDRPRRKTGTFTLHRDASFIGFVNLHREDATAIYADEHEDGIPTLTAVFNEHRDMFDGQDWRDFRATYTPDKSTELMDWLGSDREAVDQETFALFLEDHAEDIRGDWDGRKREALSDDDLMAGKVPDAVDPTTALPNGAAVTKFARDLLIAKDYKVQSTIDPQTGGRRLTYIDDETAETKANLASFARFRLSIPVFEGGAAYLFDARLRVVPKGPRVYFQFELIRADKVVRQAVDDLVAAVKAGTGIENRFFFGAP